MIVATSAFPAITAIPTADLATAVKLEVQRLFAIRLENARVCIILQAGFAISAALATIIIQNVYVSFCI